MKKIVISLLLLICAVSLNAQKYFELTPHWLVSVTDSTKNYVVITIDSSSAEMLYKKTITYINMTYKNPEAVIRGKSENEFISFVTHDNLFSFNNMISIVVEGDYFTTISFKKDKIKISFTDINMYSFNSKGKWIFNLTDSGIMANWHVYKPNGEIAFPKKDFKTKIEMYFNNKVDEIISGIKKSGEIKNENW